MMGRETAGLFFSRTYDFLERYLPRQAGRSPETVRAYRDALTVFRRYARDVLGKGVGDLAFGDVDRDCVLGWLERMGEEGLSAATRNQRLAAIRSYLWYAADCDVAVTSVALSVSRIPPAKGPQRVKECLSEAALRAILAAPDASTRMGARDVALMSVLYDTGIRLSELTGLTVGDALVDHEQPHVFVTGKGDKERIAPIAGTAKRAPVWMQKAKLEWLFRGILQPKRAGRLLALPKFVFRVHASKKR